MNNFIRTGWIYVKPWFTVQSYEKIHLISTEEWRCYWICFKNSNLQLFQHKSDKYPHFILKIIDCLCYPIDEYEFSLTIANGDTYCFQSLDKCESNHWIHSINFFSLVNRNEDQLKSNRKQIENDILYENKMLNLAKLQLKLTIDEKTCLLISKQIDQWGKRLEKHHIDLFRMNCYLSTSRNNDKFPCSIDLFSSMLKKTKTILSNLNILTPSGLYAFVLSREFNRTRLQSILYDVNLDKKIFVSINRKTRIQNLLKFACDQLNLNDDDYFLYFNRETSDGFIPKHNDKLKNLNYTTIEIHPKVKYKIMLNKSLNQSGIEIRKRNSTKIFISNVKQGSEGEQLGIIEDDEILLPNDSSNELDYHLNQMPILLTLRSSRFSVNQKENHQQIRNIVIELLETERSYVRDIRCLLEQYIEPLYENFNFILPSDLIESLSCILQELYQFQIEFENDLEFVILNFYLPKNNFMPIIDLFINYSKYFKLYATYCTMNLRINRLLNVHRNKQHSLSFESYLIKPVQRLLKYPLFLQQMLIYVEKDKFYLENLKLNKAIKLMRKTNEFINSIQKVYEDFGLSFENYMKQSKEGNRQMFDFKLTDLSTYGEIDWKNIDNFCSKKNLHHLKTFCFVFRNGCFLLVREQNRKKNQISLFNFQFNRINTSDRFIRFLPMNQLEIRLITDFHNDQNSIWKLIQTDMETQLRTEFCFAQTDSSHLIKSIECHLSKLKCQQENNPIINKTTQT